MMNCDPSCPLLPFLLPTIRSEVMDASRNGRGEAIRNTTDTVFIEPGKGVRARILRLGKTAKDRSESRSGPSRWFDFLLPSIMLPDTGATSPLL